MKEIMKKIKEFNAAAVAEGVIEQDEWACLDEMWDGPSIDLNSITVLAADTMKLVRVAYAEGKASQELVGKAFDLIDGFIPFIPGL